MLRTINLDFIEVRASKTEHNIGEFWYECFYEETFDDMKKAMEEFNKLVANNEVHRVIIQLSVEYYYNDGGHVHSFSSRNTIAHYNSKEREFEHNGDSPQKWKKREKRENKEKEKKNNKK